MESGEEEDAEELDEEEACRGCSGVRWCPRRGRRRSSGRRGRRWRGRARMPATSARVWRRKTANMGTLTCSERLRACLEDRSFGDGEADVEAEEHEHGAGEEGKAPAEGEELIVGERVGEQEKDSAGKEEADGRAELRKHAVPGAFAGRGVFDGEQDGAAPFASEADALAEAAEGEEQRRGDSDVCVGGQQRRWRPWKVPWSRRATTRVVLRPMRSPKWPKSAEPMGRARKAMPKVASEARVGGGGVGCRERRGGGKPGPRRWRRCRSRKTRWWCRPGWRREPGGAY